MTIVRRLVGYANDGGRQRPLFYAESRFRWRLDLFSDGRAARVVDAREPAARGDASGGDLIRWAPSVTRTNAIAPRVGADEAQYVLGCADTTTRASRVAQCSGAFADLMCRWADTTGDPVATVVSEFYRCDQARSMPLPDTMTAKHKVLITVDGSDVIDRASAAQFWADEVLARQSGAQSPRTGVCLVCGDTDRLITIMPDALSPSLLPGHDMMPAALITVNASAFGYGLVRSLVHTPICFACAQASMAGLTRLLSSDQALRVPGQDSVTLWWVRGGPHDLDKVMPDTAHPEAIRALVAQFQRGELDAAVAASSGQDDRRFCALTITVHKARISVVDWIDMPLAQARRNLGAWHEHTRVDTAQAMSLRGWVAATGQWMRSEGRYADLQPPRGNPNSRTTQRRSPRALRDLLPPMLHGTPLPPTMLGALLRRIRSDARIDSRRVGLLRLALLRSPVDAIAVPAAHDPNFTNTVYRIGHAFAVLARIEDTAPKPTRSHPGVWHDMITTLPALKPTTALARARHQLDFLREHSNPAVQGNAAQLTKELREQTALTTNTLPSHLTLPQQALVIIGFWHHIEARSSRTCEHLAVADAGRVL